MAPPSYLAGRPASFAGLADAVLEAVPGGAGGERHFQARGAASGTPRARERPPARPPTHPPLRQVHTQLLAYRSEFFSSLFASATPKRVKADPDAGGGGAASSAAAPPAGEAAAALPVYRLPEAARATPHALELLLRFAYASLERPPDLTPDDAIALAPLAYFCAMTDVCKACDERAAARVPALSTREQELAALMDVAFRWVGVGRWVGKRGGAVSVGCGWVGG